MLLIFFGVALLFVAFVSHVKARMRDSDSDSDFGDIAPPKKWKRARVSVSTAVDLVPEMSESLARKIAPKKVWKMRERVPEPEPGPEHFSARAFDAEFEIPAGLGEWRKDASMRLGKVMQKTEGDALRDENEVVTHLRRENPVETDYTIFLDTTNGNHNYWVWLFDRGVYVCSRDTTQSVSKLASAEKEEFDGPRISQFVVASKVRVAASVFGPPPPKRPYGEGRWTEDPARELTAYENAEETLIELVMSTRAIRKRKWVVPSADAATAWNYDEDERIHETRRLNPTSVWNDGVNPDVINLFDKEWTQYTWERARERGTAGHLELEKYYNGMALSEKFKASPQGKAFAEFERAYPWYNRQTVFRTELSMFDETLGLPGQADAIFKVVESDGTQLQDKEGRFVYDILDWKFTEKMTPSKLSGYKKQLPMYAYLLTKCVANSVVRKLLLVVLNPLPGAGFEVIEVQFDRAALRETLERQVAWLEAKRTADGSAETDGEDELDFGREL